MSTIREHAEAIRDSHSGCGNCQHGFLCPEVEHAQAILDALDAAEIRLPMMVDAGMGNVEFIDDALTPEGADLYRAAKRHRLVPDPGVAGSPDAGDTQ